MGRVLDSSALLVDRYLKQLNYPLWLGSRELQTNGKGLSFPSTIHPFMVHWWEWWLLVHSCHELGKSDYKLTCLCYTGLVNSPLKQVANCLMALLPPSWQVQLLKPMLLGYCFYLIISWVGFFFLLNFGPPIASV
jgi:hypothetical protein